MHGGHLDPEKDGPQRGGSDVYRQQILLHVGLVDICGDPAGWPDPTLTDRPRLIQNQAGTSVARLGGRVRWEDAWDSEREAV